MRLVLIAVAGLRAIAAAALVVSEHANSRLDGSSRIKSGKLLERRQAAEFAYLNKHPHALASSFISTIPLPSKPKILTPITTTVVPSIPIKTSTNTAGHTIETVISGSQKPSTSGSIITDVTTQSGAQTVTPIISTSISSPTSKIQATGSTLSPSTVMGNLPAPTQNIFAQPIDTRPPLNVFPQRADHPVPRKGVLKRTPLGTNKFYANFFIADQNTPCYTHPYSLTWSAGTKFNGSWGIAISHTNESLRFYGPDVYGIGAVNYFGNPVGVYSIIIGAAELGRTSVLTTSSATDTSIVVLLRPAPNADPIIMFPVVQGMGFVTASYFGATPVINSGILFRKILKTPNSPRNGIYKFVVELENNSKWYIYAISSNGAPLDIKLESQSQLRATSGFSGVLQVAKEPGTNEGMALYDQAVGTWAVNLRMNGRVNGNTGQYSFEWIRGGDLTNPKLLMWALPHHVESFDAATARQKTSLQMMLTTKGMATAVMADSWTMVEPSLPLNMSFKPWDPTRGNLNVPKKANATIYPIAQTELSQNMDAQTNLDSMYFSGKALAKFAMLVYSVSELLGDRALAATGLTNLKQAFARFSSNKQINPLVYESWGGLISSAGYADAMADFGNGYYNDHHFHYGYHVLAAAIIGTLDPTWVEPNKQYVNALVRDYANPSPVDTYFPTWRSFDWFHGHSWAHGLFATEDGKNQESSSEDMMSIYALKMWGQVIGDGTLEARSNLQLQVLSRSLKKYFLYESSNTVVPPNFAKNKVAGILFENKIDHTTFFGSNVEFVQGIHMIPLLPATMLVRTPTLVREEWATFFDKGRVNNVQGGWRGILMGNIGTIEPQTAWNFFAASNFDPGWIDGGVTRTWYLCFAAALAGDSLVVKG